ncbi:MAG: helix-turn-helix transcriptional regulator [Ruminococcaceae bacterium]|nr:helix-turn-helix transcriptional regulator [Oscillospiraceae bacterium]
MEQNTVIENIVKLLKEQKKTQKNLTDYLGITQNAFTDWKSGRIKSYNKHLPKIAEFFGVSVDYILGTVTDAKKEHDTRASSLIKNTFTEREWNVINAYRAQPELQTAVERLLGIEEGGRSYVYVAAHSEDRHPDVIRRISKDELAKLKNAPETDETLL